MLDVDATGLSATLRAWARSHPDGAAIVEPIGGAWRTITFGEFDRLVDRYAHGLHKIGVRAGDRAIFLVRPNVEALAALYALTRLGSVPVAIDPGMGLREMLRCVGDTRARVLLGVPAIHSLRFFVPPPFPPPPLSTTPTPCRPL